MKRAFALFLSLCLFGAVLCGCEGISSIMDRNNGPDTMILPQDIVLYQEPDGTSEHLGRVRAGKEIEFVSSKRINGVWWYETQDGWFALFEPDNSGSNGSANGHVILSGFATGEIDLLSSAGASASVIGFLDVGTYVEIYQIRDLWAQTDRGWVEMAKVYVPGRTGVNPGWCLTLKNYLGCYNAPSFDSTKMTEYKAMQRLKIYETIVIGDVSWGYTDSGWICLDDTYVEGTVGTGACTVKVTDKTPLNVRVGPGTSYDVIRTLNIRSVVEVLYQVNNGSDDWGFIGDGWIYMDLTEVQ